jgi:hypothetical protein
MPLAPADRNDSPSVCTCDGAVHVPAGVPGVKVAWVRSATYTFDGLLNSAGASAIPVEQSSPDESSSPPDGVVAFSKNAGLVVFATFTIS